MRNNRGPNTEPWGIPDSIVEKSANDPLRTTRCFLLFKQFCSNFSNEPDTPFCFSLKINPSCHTLSNALEISKNIARTSRDLVSSKDW